MSQTSEKTDIRLYELLKEQVEIRFSTEIDDWLRWNGFCQNQVVEITTALIDEWAIDWKKQILDLVEAKMIEDKNHPKPFDCANRCDWPNCTLKGCVIN